MPEPYAWTPHYSDDRLLHTVHDTYSRPTRYVVVLCEGVLYVWLACQRTWTPALLTKVSYPPGHAFYVPSNISNTHFVAHTEDGVHSSNKWEGMHQMLATRPPPLREPQSFLSSSRARSLSRSLALHLGITYDPAQRARADMWVPSANLLALYPVRQSRRIAAAEWKYESTRHGMSRHNGPTVKPYGWQCVRAMSISEFRIRISKIRSGWLIYTTTSLPPCTTPYSTPDILIAQGGDTQSLISDESRAVPSHTYQSRDGTDSIKLWSWGSK